MIIAEEIDKDRKKFDTDINGEQSCLFNMYMASMIQFMRIFECLITFLTFFTFHHFYPLFGEINGVIK